MTNYRAQYLSHDTPIFSNSLVIHILKCLLKGHLKHTLDIHVEICKILVIYKDVIYGYTSSTLWSLWNTVRKELKPTKYQALSQ